jgi:hypothetical protein
MGDGYSDIIYSSKERGHRNYGVLNAGFGYKRNKSREVNNPFRAAFIA